MSLTPNASILEIAHSLNKTKFDQFNLKYLNINSIRNKIFELENEINSNNKKIQFIALTEIRIFPNESDLFNLPNYNSYFSCCTDGHRGAALFVHDSIDSSLIESNTQFKINYVIVKIPALKASIAVIYKKPTVSKEKFFTVLTHILTKANNIILVGDTNFNVQGHSTKITEYYSLIDSLGCSLLNNTDKKFATRINRHINARHTKSSTIDHIISNCLHFKFKVCVNDSHLSDHREIFLSFHDTSNSTINFCNSVNHFVCKNLNVIKFKQLLCQQLPLYRPINLCSLLQLIDNTKKRCVESRVINKEKNPYKNWVTAELTDLIAERNRYHNLLKKYPTSEFLKSKYIEFCALVRSLNNKNRRTYNSSQLNKCISKPRQLWRCFNEIIHNKPKTPNEIKSIALTNGTITHDPIEIANEINTFFCNIGRELSMKIPPTDPTYTTLIQDNPHTMALFPVTPAELQSIVLNTKPNSNLNNILPIDHVKQCLDILTEPLNEFVNKCFDDGTFPEKLKKARIVPIFKNGDSLSPANYRPISILDDFSKILEQCIYERVYSFAQRFKLISEFQFGFQKQSGTLSAVARMIDTIRSFLDASCKNICACIFIDITKAFDSMLHELLLKKLYRMGFRGKIHDLIRSFLSNRTQYISTSSGNSDPQNITFGTPQGSTLGPALFILFINDIAKLKLHGKIILFADDAVLIYCESDLNELNRKMTEDMETILNWFHANLLTLNQKKTKCMIFHSKQHLKQYKLNIHLNGHVIEQVDSFEYLGITLQENLHWDLHTNKIAKKINRISGVTHRIAICSTSFHIKQ